MKPNLTFKDRAGTPGAPVVLAALREAPAIAAATGDLPHRGLDITAERNMDGHGADAGHRTTRTEPGTGMLPKSIQLDIFGGDSE